MIRENEKVQYLVSLVYKLEGLPRHISTHRGGNHYIRCRFSELHSLARGD